MTDYVKAGPAANTLHCEQCGQILELAMPIKLNQAVSIMQSFISLHQWCIFRPVFAEDQRLRTRTEDALRPSHLVGHVDP